MSDTKVQLGDFTFGRFEVPEKIPFGGDQQLVVHKLIGGKRQIDAMGEDPLALEWSGHLVGASALPRALYLDGLRKAGKALALTWSELSYSVVIKSFHCDFLRSYRLQYSITCEVSADNTAPITTITAPSFEQAVADDAAQAAALAAQMNSDPLTAAMAKVTAALASVQTGVSTAQSQIDQVLQPIAEAQGIVGGLLTQTTGILQGAAAIGGVIPGNPVTGQVANLIGQIGAIEQQPTLLALNSTLGRMATNLSSVNGGTSSITVAGGDLYSIATAEYGDAMGWTALADANGLSDPELIGINTLVVPPFTNDTGGVLHV